MVGFQNTSIFGEAGSEKAGKSDNEESAGTNPLCPQCGSKRLYRDGLRYLADGSSVQRWLCRDCAYRFSERPSQEKSEWSINTDSDLPSRRQICATLKEAKNLEPQTEIKTVAGEESIDVKGKLLQFALFMLKEGLAQSTIEKWNVAMKRLSKIADINDPESVKAGIAYLKIEENTKSTYCSIYETFLRFAGKTWNRPRYECHQKIPEFLPTEEEIDQLIAGSGKKVGTMLALMKETGMRLGECLSLPCICIDSQRDVVTLTTAEKHSLPRIFKVSHTLISMLQNLPKQNEKVFGTMTTSSAGVGLREARKRVAHKLVSPRIAKIHYHLIRHWFGTMEYHKKPDIDYVRRRLGHKSVLNTQIYMHLEEVMFTTKSDEYVVKTAVTVAEIAKLLEVGFDYITEVEGVKMFRKRK